MAGRPLAGRPAVSAHNKTLHPETALMKIDETFSKSSLRSMGGSIKLCVQRESPTNVEDVYRSVLDVSIGNQNQNLAISAGRQVCVLSTFPGPYRQKKNDGGELDEEDITVDL